MRDLNGKVGAAVRAIAAHLTPPFVEGVFYCHGEFRDGAVSCGFSCPVGLVRADVIANQESLVDWLPLLSDFEDTLEEESPLDDAGSDSGREVKRHAIEHV